MADGDPSSSAGRSRLASRLALAFTLVLVLTSAAQMAYRYTLPTDGWAFHEDYFGEDQTEAMLFYKDLVGGSSPLRSGDALLAVDGTPVSSNGLDISLEVRDWRVGGRVIYTVYRDGQRLDLAVTPVHWTPAALWRYNALDPTKANAVLGAVIVFVVGLFVYFKKPADGAAQMLLLISGIGLALTLSGLLPDGISVQMNRSAALLTSFFSYAIFGTLYAPAILAFTLVFPRPKPIVARHGLIALVPFLIGGLIFIILYADGPIAVGWGGTMAMIILSVLSLVHSGLTMRDSVSRAQLRWAVGGLALGLGAFLVVFPFAFNWVTSDQILVYTLADIVASSAMAIIGLALGVAILRYRLFDIDVIIRRTLVYGLLTVLLALVYFGSVVIFQSLFAALTGERSTLAVVFSTLVIAALFNPVRGRVQALIDRRFFRRKYDAAQALGRFAATARDEVDLDQLTVALLQVVNETVQPASAKLWLAESDSRRGRVNV